MEYKVTKIKGKDLKPGDLFSTMGQLYWNNKNIKAHRSIGERVYIRTEEPCPKRAENDVVYKIEIIN